MYDRILTFVKQNITLFQSFDEIYLFGSSLNENTYPRDIDLLLIYSKHRSNAIRDLKNISSTVYEAFQIPVDLTVLSVEELKDTMFLKRIGNQIKLK